MFWEGGKKRNQNPHGEVGREITLQNGGMG